MIIRYDSLQQRSDEDALLHRVKLQAEDAINHLGPTPFSPPRIQPGDIHAYHENASASNRTWLVTISHGDRFLVRVSLDFHPEHWHAEVIDWVASSRGGIYYLKAVPQQETHVLDAIYNNNLSQGGPIGYAHHVGNTNEAVPRSVYWLYEESTGQPSEQRQRRIDGDYLLIERRFIPLAPSLQWHVSKQ